MDRNTKIRIYRTLIRPVVAYGCEVWVITKKDVKQLRVFERKILIRRIYGSVQEAGTCRIRRNGRLSQLNDGHDIARYIKIQRLTWLGSRLGHVQRMQNTQTTKKIMQWKQLHKKLGIHENELSCVLLKNISKSMICYCFHARSIKPRKKVFDIPFQWRRCV